MKFLPVTDTGHIMFGGKITVEQRADDWIAFSTTAPACFEVGISPDHAIERLIDKYPSLIS